MSVSFLGTVGTFQNAGAATTAFDLTVGIDVPAGSRVCVAVETNNNASGPSGVTDSAGNTYVLEADTGGSGGSVSHVFTASGRLDTALAPGDTITVTMTGSITRLAAVADAFSDADDLDGTHTGIGNSASPSSGATGTLTDADSFAWAAFGISSPAEDPTIGSGFTSASTTVTTAGTNERRIRTAYKILSSTSAVTATATVATSSRWAAAVSTYVAISAPPPSESWSVWNGATEDPLTLDGVWNGSSIDALTPDTVT